MPDLFLERHVPHLIERMFDLVSDLDDYPRFLPNVHSHAGEAGRDGAEATCVSLK